MSSDILQDLIQKELKDVKDNCERVVEGSNLVTCVRDLIRVELAPTEFRRVAICLCFPPDYPSSLLLIELKSKTISDKLLMGLVKVTEENARKNRDPRVLTSIAFISKFFEENPLACCSDEISRIRSKMNEAQDKLKLSQKSSSISLSISAPNCYFYKLKINIPFEYPAKQTTFEDVETNFPRVFKAWFTEQSREIARRCVVPPLMKKKSSSVPPAFVPSPSLEPVVNFLIENVKRYPLESCGICRKTCLPLDPAHVIHNENAAAHVERVYCSHCYHHDCLILYMKSPPFKGVKKCTLCNQRIYHEKWKVTPELAEARWAHQQAKERELGEVIDFFKE
eukprot:TRINITY_DN4182_c0_g1_i1.p1 TRINITY_DN4182_c0_g1~~TRINITY_DN4182_c0_g1_i1.p1  ORF type:complete len:338 (+),score=90.32 TRINITY_DN4182_c0_g1_i1:392-1405(+)